MWWLVRQRYHGSQSDDSSIALGKVEDARGFIKITKISGTYHGIKRYIFGHEKVDAHLHTFAR